MTKEKELSLAQLEYMPCFSILQKELKKSLKANAVKCYQPTLAKSSKTVKKLKHHCPHKVRDGCLNVFANFILYSGGCYEMVLCFLLARRCPGGMEHAAASQVRHSWLHLLVRGVIQVSKFQIFFSFQLWLRLLPSTVRCTD